MKKMDEMESKHTGVAARYGFAFYTFALIIWSLISYIQNGETGWQFPITMGGLAVFFITRVFFKRATSN